MKHLNVEWSPETTVKTGKRVSKLFSAACLFTAFVLTFMIAACDDDVHNEYPDDRPNDRENTENPRNPANPDDSGKSDTVSARDWKQLANFGGAKRSGAVCFVINGKIYAGLGAAGNISFNDLWEYNPSTGKWTQKANCPKSGSICFAADGRGYVFSGVELWEYNVADDRWTQKAGLSGGAVGFAFASDRKGYAGVRFASDSCGFFEYDTQNDSWTQKNISVNVLPFHSQSVCMNSRGYVFGNGVPYSMPHIVWEYDIKSDRWTPKSDMPVYMNGFVAFALNNRIYAGMGNSGSSYYGNILYELDPEKNDWQKKSERPTNTGRENAIAAVVGNKAYFGLGVTGKDGYYNDFWELRVES
jgi:hypothetical protein